MTEGTENTGASVPVDAFVMPSRPSVDDVLKKLRGDKEILRQILTDQAELLAKVCRYAKWKGDLQKRPPWSVIGEITGHGSGVASAIYDLYRDYEE